MIHAGSRYVSGNVFVQPDSTVAVERVFPRRLSSVVYYTWRASDRLDLVAARTLGDPKLWWQIMDENPLVQDPNDIVPGQQIRIPKRV